MKLQHLGIMLSALAFVPQSQAAWLNTEKSFLATGIAVEAEKTAQPNIADMVAALTNELGVSESQATGGLGAIFNYAKDNLSAKKFNSISSALPGLSGLLNAAPDTSAKTSKHGLGGLMDKAANYNDSLKALNEVKKQFSALGLKPEMIGQFVNVTKQYLDTDQGKKIKDTLMQGLAKLAS